jgi:hypothetical protein
VIEVDDLMRREMESWFVVMKFVQTCEAKKVPNDLGNLGEELEECGCGMAVEEW